jgi:hypothetical protein
MNSHLGTSAAVRHSGWRPAVQTEPAQCRRQPRNRNEHPYTLRCWCGHRLRNRRCRGVCSGQQTRQEPGAPNGALEAVDRQAHARLLPLDPWARSWLQSQRRCAGGDKIRSSAERASGTHEPYRSPLNCNSKTGLAFGTGAQHARYELMGSRAQTAAISLSTFQARRKTGTLVLHQSVPCHLAPSQNRICQPRRLRPQLAGIWQEPKVLAFRNMSC